MRVLLGGPEPVWALESEEDTQVLGTALGRLLSEEDVVGLTGDLGAGKTTLTRSIALGFGVPEGVPVNSPTFTLMNLYEASGRRLCHLDFYRLDHVEELEGLGLGDLEHQGAAFVVEWLDRIADAFEDVLSLHLRVTGMDSREVSLRSGGPRSTELLDSLRSGLSLEGSAPLVIS